MGDKGKKDKGKKENQKKAKLTLKQKRKQKKEKKLKKHNNAPDHSLSAKLRRTGPVAASGMPAVRFF